ncbi:hypothetical protein TNCV_2037601 [Trichonephila clavipes]|nr:hypothetical protein TNCV_2037601 [Trichonephila clavipes]
MLRPRKNGTAALGNHYFRLSRSICCFVLPKVDSQNLQPLFYFISIHLVLGLPLSLFPSGVRKVIFFTRFPSLDRNMSQQPYLRSLYHFDCVKFSVFRLKFKVVFRILQIPFSLSAPKIFSSSGKSVEQASNDGIPFHSIPLFYSVPTRRHTGVTD